MKVTKNKKMLIKGAGKFMAKIPNCDDLITIGTLNNMRLDIQLDMQDIEGGDSSVPLDTLLRKKTIDITAEDAKFDLNLVRLVLGSKLREGVSGAAYSMVTETVVVPSESPYQVTLSNTAIASPAPKAFEGAVTGADVTSNVTVTGKTAVFDMALAGKTIVVVYAVALTGVTQDADGFVWELEEKHTVKQAGSDFVVDLVFGTSIHTDPQISVRTLKGNKLLKKIASGSPNEDQYTVSGGKLKFNSALKDVDIYVNYKRNEVVDILDITTKDMPLTVHVVHDGRFEQKDGTIQGYQIELYQCRVKSNFTLDAQRQQASTHSVTLTVIDPERPDNKLGTIKRYEVGNTQAADLC
ncbi:hypothetical protein SECTIM467_32 [Brevibacillus phage SecTim467]|uniref:Tail protein n=2 Tax=Jenstvirus jenst TaxID=1982225 RepID=A0A0K2CNX7_9CAUD|nr:virion structural protein [Brevibacillus phage Jenst]ALA07162.1 hypothetical protein JENST_32 [Brevibacillus phage Jenst]ALA07532.1 hypothetical protein SECTIM467_32 [Brevibacillus phage SecTim467]